MDRPLTGKHILITRAPEQAGELAAALADRGAELSFYPLLRIGPPADSTLLDAALTDLAGFDLVVFSSRNGVERCCQRARERGVAWADWPPVAAIGAGTAQAAQAQSLQVQLMPTRADAEGLVAAIREQLPPSRALLPQAHNARTVLAEGLRAAGWRVTAVEAYQGLAADPGELPDPATLDAVTFASAATVERFITAAGAAAWSRLRADGCALVAIGEQTAQAIRDHDGVVAAVAVEATMAALADAVVCALIG